MIAVVGRPGLGSTSAGGRSAGLGLAGLGARVALEAVAAGARVELVGSIGDDPEGDEVMIQLGRARVGHAALLRDPANRTPVAGRPPVGSLPHLDAHDVELGLRYLADVRVLVLPEPLGAEVSATVLEAAAYHGASVVAVTEDDSEDGADWPESATVLVAPPAGAPQGRERFAVLLGRYAAALDAGSPADEAWRKATEAAGWEVASA